MVSGFVTSPCDQLRIFSGEARLMRMASKSAIGFAISKGLERYKVFPDSCGANASADGPRKSVVGHWPLVVGFYPNLAFATEIFGLTLTRANRQVRIFQICWLVNRFLPSLFLPTTKSHRPTTVS